MAPATKAPAPPEVAPTVEKPALGRRLLQEWDEQRAGMLPLPKPGRGPLGEEIVATLCSSHPAEIDRMSGMGWSVAQAGDGEILNEESYTVTPEGRMIHSDMVVVIRKASVDRKFRAAEEAAAARLASIPKDNIAKSDPDTEVGVLRVGEQE